MTNKNNKTKIAGRMALAFGKDITSLLSSSLMGVVGLTGILAGGAGYLASMPIIGSLNPSLKERIYTKLEKLNGEDNDFSARMHGSENAGIATALSMITMPFVYGYLGYLTNPNKYGFASGVLAGLGETAVRVIMHGNSRNLSYMPGTILGSTLGVIGETSYDYLKDTYNAVKSEEETK